MLSEALRQNREAVRFPLTTVKGQSCYYGVSLFNDLNIRPFTFSPEATPALSIHKILEWQASTRSVDTNTLKQVILQNITVHHRHTVYKKQLIT